MNVHMLPNISCPTCQSSHVFRAEYEGLVERTILRLFDMFPLLCQACDMRFYMFQAKSSDLDPERVQSWRDAGVGKSNSSISYQGGASSMDRGQRSLWPETPQGP